MNGVNNYYPSEQCNICLDDYKKNEANKCLRLRCGHIFHEICVSDWISNQRNCPSCRSKVIVSWGSIGNEIFTGVGVDLKKFRKGTNFAVAIILVYIFAENILNYLLPGRFLSTAEKISLCSKSDCFLYNRKVVNLSLTGLVIITITAIIFRVVYYIFKTFDLANQKAQRIDYIPLELEQ